MRDALRAAGLALLLAAGVFALLSALPATSAWGSATYVSGARTVASPQDAVGVLSLRILATLALTGALLLAASMWRRR